MLMRRLARPMLAATFVATGVASLRDPAVEQGRLVPLADRLPYVPEDARTLARAVGGVQVGAGLLLAAGRFPRVCAAALAATLVPSTLARHRFWQEKDPQVRAEQATHLVKNVSLAGGLLIAAADTEGRPGLSWRARRARRTTRHAFRAGRREARLATHAGRERVARKGSQGVQAARHALHV